MLDVLFPAISDALFLAVIVAFFAVCALLVRTCERMWGGGRVWHRPSRHRLGWCRHHRPAGLSRHRADLSRAVL